MSAAAQISWDQSQAAPQVQWDEERQQPAQPEKKSFFQRVRDWMPEGLIRQELEKGADWAARKQQEAYEENTARAAKGQPYRTDPRAIAYSPGTGYGMLSSLMRYAAGAVQPKPKEAAIGAAAIAAPEIVGPAMVAHGGLQLARNLPEALRGNPEAVEKTFLAGSEAASGGAMTGGAIASPAPTMTGRLVRAGNRALIKGEPPAAIVPAAPKAFTQAIQPGVNIPRAQESIQIAGPRIQQLRQAGALRDLDGNPISEIRSTGQLLGAVRSAKQAVIGAIEQRLGPVEQLQVDASAAGKAMRDSISKRVREQFPQQAARIEARSAAYDKPMSLRDIEDAIIDANDDLKGFYKQPVAGESPVTADTRATQAEVRVLRNLLHTKEEELSGAGVKDLKREYGALRDVERAAARQHAIRTRTKEGGLWEGLSYLHAAGDLLSGNALGAARAGGALAVGRMLKTLRNPDFLIEQSFHGPKAFAPAEPIARAPGPPQPRALLGPGATPLGPGIQPDTSGTFRDPTARWATPRAALPEPSPTPAKFIREIKRQSVKPAPEVRGFLPSGEAPETSIPPVPEEQFTREEVRPSAAGAEFAPERRLGTMGRGGVRTTPAAQLPGVAESILPEQASLLVRQTLDIMRSADRPGRYFAETTPEEHTLAGRRDFKHGERMGGHWYSVGSLRDQLPWIKETEFTPQQLEQALQSLEKGRITKVMRSAMDYLRRGAGPRMREPGEEEGLPEPKGPGINALKLIQALKRINKVGR